MEKIGAKESRKNKKKKMTASDVVLILRCMWQMWMAIRTL